MCRELLIPLQAGRCYVLRQYTRHRCMKLSSMVNIRESTSVWKIKREKKKNTVPDQSEE